MTEEWRPVLQAALEEALRRIRQHQRHASDGVSHMLGAIGERLRDPDLGVEELQRLCPPGCGTNQQFLVELGSKPKAYFERLRLDLARALVCESEAKVTVIATTLGFRRPKYFSKWFERRTGLSPEKLRSTLRRPRADGPQERTPEPWTPSQIWHRCLLKCASPNEADSLIRDLREIYPGNVPDDAEPDPAEEAER